MLRGQIEPFGFVIIHKTIKKDKSYNQEFLSSEGNLAFIS